LTQQGERLPRRSPPLFMGCIVVQHTGCWASDTSNKFSSITLEIAVTGYDPSSYELYVVIKPKNGQPLGEEMRERIVGFINLHPLVEFGSIVIETDTEVIMHLRVVDSGGPRGVIRPVVMFGAIQTEICDHVEDGKEYVWGVYENREAFDNCKEVAKRIYGTDAIIEAECWFSKSHGFAEAEVARPHPPSLFPRLCFVTE